MIDEIPGMKDVLRLSLIQHRYLKHNLLSTESTEKSHPTATITWLNDYETDDLKEFDIVHTVEGLALNPSKEEAGILPITGTTQTEAGMTDNDVTSLSLPISLRLILLGEATDEVKEQIMSKLCQIDSIWFNDCSVVEATANDEAEPTGCAIQNSHHALDIKIIDCRYSATPDAIIDYMLERTGLDPATHPPQDRLEVVDLVLYFCDSDQAKLERSIKLLRILNGLQASILPICLEHETESNNHVNHSACQYALQNEDIAVLQRNDTWQTSSTDHADMLNVDQLINIDNQSIEELILAAYSAKASQCTAAFPSTPTLDLTPDVSETQSLDLSLEDESNSRHIGPFMLFAITFTMLTVLYGLISEEDSAKDKLSAKWLNMSMDTSEPYFQAKLNPMWTTLDPVDHTHYFVVELSDLTGYRLPNEIGEDEIVDAVVVKKSRVSDGLIEEYEVINVPHLERGLFGVQVTSPCYDESVEEVRVELWLSEYDMQVDGSPVTLSIDTCVEGRHGAGTRATETTTTTGFPSSQPRPTNPDGSSGGHIVFRSKKNQRKNRFYQRWFQSVETFLNSMIEYFIKAAFQPYTSLPQQATPTGNS
ncbi:hypothetical protein INT43_003144 [Umbelopsis isabellina]|uniref:Uncharacterized protein n=1 Tax=Mortierella isabellina TaxID=91625 RepID=A0A8H7PPJ4_MORIS|nr:hypothetical protein INT43_003144 [Umbelopsis isabellina]